MVGSRFFQVESLEWRAWRARVWMVGVRDRGVGEGGVRDGVSRWRLGLEPGVEMVFLEEVEGVRVLLLGDP